MSDAARFFKEIAKTNKMSRALFLRAKQNKINKQFRPEDIIHIVPIKEDNEKPRINIILITLQMHAIYGGVSTAIRFFTELNIEGFDKRIIIQSPEHYNQHLSAKINGFMLNRDNNGIYFLSENNRLEIRKNDVFIATGWKTAYIVPQILDWQEQTYGVNNKFIYFIQDFEPCFFPWSTEYALAESTYKIYFDRMFAVFNSKELYDFFINNGYSFYSKCYFTPRINDTLKKILKATNTNTLPRKKRILIYGRPSFPRNAFGIIRSAMNIWANTYSRQGEWEVISLGESFGKIKICDNTIKSYGKVSIEQYAELMKSSYLGVSLMISPHPSYPPLEMSSFGMRTITNSYANKDLSGFNSNIISIKNIKPDLLAKQISELCDEYDIYDSQFSFNNDYFNGTSFEKMLREMEETINQMICDENRGNRL